MPAYDDLPWQEAALPSRADWEYEGFYGLEELDDVDVIRDGDTVTLKVNEGRKAKKLKTSHPRPVPESSTPAPQAKHAHKDAVKAAPAPTPVPASVPVSTPVPTPAPAVPPPVNAVSMKAWRRLKLSQTTLGALQTLKFKEPTKIQAAAIPVIMAGEDVIAKASTGSGKTLAFGIPILEAFLAEPRDARSTGAFALVLSPTRELAHQIGKHLEALSPATGSPSIVTLTGGLSMQKQRRLLAKADVVVGTPGRVWELMQEDTSLLVRVKYLVMDEADRLLAAGHFKECESILGLLEGDADDQPKRQTLIFSATFDRELQSKLSKQSYRSDDEPMAYLLSKIKFRGEPKFIDTNPIKQLATGLKEGLVECDGMEKDLYLYTILLHNQKCRSMVFVNSISAVRRITPFLENLGLPALALHSGMIQKARLRSLERFAAKTSILIATDVAARGLDIPNVDLVVHYHLPRAADMYVHRSGRTARAGKQGSSILICSPGEVGGVRRLVAKVHAQAAVEDRSQAAKHGYYIRTLEPDRKVVSRLKPRATLAKKLADVNIAKEKRHKDDDFFAEAAEDLGVDYDSDLGNAPGRRGRGAGREKKEKQSRSISKAEAASMRAELRELLKQRINVGVSEKYITAGRMDIDELLRQQDTGSKTGEFLGTGSGFAVADVL